MSNGGSMLDREGLGCWVSDSGCGRLGVGMHEFVFCIMLIEHIDAMAV